MEQFSSQAFEKIESTADILIEDSFIISVGNQRSVQSGGTIDKFCKSGTYYKPQMLVNTSKTSHISISYP